MALCEEIESDLQSVRRIFFEYPRQLQSAKEKLEHNRQELLDVEHVFEFGSINGPDTMKLSKIYKDLRRERRELKDEMGALRVIEHLSNRVPEKEVTDPIGEIRNLKENQDNRSYRMRVRKDLEKYMVR